MYSANPWIESFAHTVPRWNIITKVYYYTNDPIKQSTFITICTALGWLKCLAAENKLGSESSSSLCSHRRCISVVDSKPRQKHLKRHRNSNLQQDISLQSGGQNPTDSGKWLMVDTYGNNLTYMLILAGGALRLSLRKARFILTFEWNIIFLKDKWLNNHRLSTHIQPNKF